MQKYSALIYVMCLLMMVLGCTRLQPSVHEGQYAKARNMLEDQEFGKAVEYLDKQVDRYPDDWRFYFYRGFAQYHLGENKAALRDYNTSLDMEANDPLVFANRGNIFFKKKKYYDAINDYKTALGLIESGTCDIIGGVVFQQKDIKGDAFQQTINDVAVCSYSGRAVLLYNIGLAYQNNKKLNDARAYYTKSINADESYAPAYYNRGVLALRNGQFQDALIDFNQAAELAPDHASIYCIRGETYRVLEQPKKAIDDFNKAVELNPEFGRAYYCRSLVYKSQGHMGKAKEDFTISKNLGFNPKKHKLVLKL